MWRFRIGMLRAGSTLIALFYSRLPIAVGHIREHASSRAKGRALLAT